MNWFIIPSTNKAEKFWYIADHNGKGTTTPSRVCGGVSPSTWAALPPRLEGLPRGTRQSVAATASAAASGEDFPTARSTPLEYVALLGVAAGYRVRFFGK